MKIKNITLKNNLILAPMAGVTDVGFRTLCVLSGADYAVCEMISAKALKYGSKKTQDLLITSDQEKIKVAQIFGSDPNVMAEIVKSDYLKKFDIIDINMGCPAPKIVKNKEGSALMKDIERAREIITKCVNATDKPITVKFRKGWSKDQVNAVEFAKMCEEAGASAITIHGRTQEDGYSGFADLEIIKKVKEAVKIPVIANGDVVDKESYEKMINYTKCDAVMIGRGSLGNPAVFSEILGKEPIMTKLEFIKKHIEILKQHYPDKFIVKHMRKHILWYLKGVSNATSLKQKVANMTNINEIMSELEKVLS